MTHAVHRGHIDAVGDGMRALDGPPCVVLRGAKLVFLRRVPADGRGIKQHLRALQRREPRAFGIPLIPADQRAHAAKRRVHGLKAKIARRKVILLVIERIVGDVHLAVDAGDVAIGIQRDRGVVIKPRRAPLKQRRDDRHVQLARQPRPASRGRPRNRLGQIEQLQVFALAKVLRAEELRQADDLRAQPRGLADVVDRGGEVRLRVQRPCASARGRP